MSKISHSAADPASPVAGPDYEGKGIVNLMGSIVAGLGGEPQGYATLGELPPQSLHHARNVVLLVIDGLGYEWLISRWNGSHLAEHTRCQMSSVFPPTTAAAVTTFLTATAPLQHGLPGWFTYFRELGAVIAVLPFRARYGDAPLADAGIDAASLFEHVPVFDRLPVASYCVLPQQIADSPFSRAHTGRASIKRFVTLAEMFTAIEAALHEHEHRKYVYAYWPHLDSLGHAHGIDSPEAHAHYAELDAGFARFLAAIRGSETLVLATADHGFVDSGPAYRIQVGDYPEINDALALPLCGDNRLAYCYVRAGKRRQFEQAVQAELGNVASLHRSLDLVERGYFGLGEAHSRFGERIGDYVLAMTAPYTISDHVLGEGSFQLVGAHGGMSSAELLVPLAVVEC